MRDPVISVIITYHNEGELLLRALESVEAQTYRGGAEVLVVDDASVVPPPLPGGGRFPARLVRSDRNIRLPAARNLGVRESRGQYVTFLDADDVFFPDKIERQVAFLEEHPDALLVGGASVVHRDGKVWHELPEMIERCFPDLAGRACILPDRVRHDLCLYYGFHSGATTIRRRALEAVGGFRDEYHWGEEWDVLVRIAQVGRIGHVPEPAQRYLCRESGSMTTIHNPEKYVSGADQCRAWRRTVAGLPASYRRALRAKEREWRLLAAQVYLEGRGRPLASLEHAVRSLLCVPSLWGVRSSVRSALHCLVPPGLRWLPSR